MLITPYNGFSHPFCKLIHLSIILFLCAVTLHKMLGSSWNGLFIYTAHTHILNSQIINKIGSLFWLYSNEHRFTTFILFIHMYSTAFEYVPTCVRVSVYIFLFLFFSFTVWPLCHSTYSLFHNTHAQTQCQDFSVHPMCVCVCVRMWLDEVRWDEVWCVLTIHWVCVVDTDLGYH